LVIQIPKLPQIFIAFKKYVYYICLMNKSILRKKILKIRESLSKKMCMLKSDKIYNNFIHFILPEIKKSKIIVVYNSFKKEVQTLKIIKYLLNKGYCVCSPCIINKEIIPCKLTSIKDLRKGPFGIPEPKKKIKLKSLSKIAAIIIPGIAFDKNGNRLGFGFGYFDKFLYKLKNNVLKIGLAFSFQVIKKIPVTKNDIKMDCIITDREIIYVDKKK